MIVTLQCGEKILIDKEDATDYVGVKLYISTHGYVMVSRYASGSRNYLHRELLSATEGQVVDHINGNKKDARKDNLRLCSQQENSYNARFRTNNTSGVRGVYYDKARGLWSAQITSKKKTKSLGRFARFEDAVKARVDAEAVYHKDFSALKGVLHEEC